MKNRAWNRAGLAFGVSATLWLPAMFFGFDTQTVVDIAVNAFSASFVTACICNA